MKWFMNMGTQTKLLSAFGAVSVALIVVGVLGIVNLGTLQKHVNTIAGVHMKGTVALLEAEADMERADGTARQLLLESDPARVRADLAEFNTAVKGMKEALVSANAILVSGDASAKLKEINEQEATWEGATRQALDLAGRNQVAQAIAVVQTATRQADELGARLEDVQALESKATDAAVAAAKATYDHSRVALILVLVTGVLYGMGLGVFIARSIAGPLARSVRVLEVVASGDFTQRLDVDTRDEVGRMATALNAAVDSMRGALTEVSASASSVSTASRELSSASQAISSGAQEQASALEETAASLEEMTSSVKQNADNAQHAAQLAQGARSIAEKGGAVVGSAVDAMTEINASSRKIADIITAIDEIAFQTNLLALNAAVEAARAGEQGRGFAVVAGEVRNLAQRSASAAKEIKGLINDSVDKVEAGSKLVDESGQTLAEIVSSVKRVTDIINEIAASSREQATGIEQVNTAVTQMDAVTQTNASQTEELAGTADGLTHQAQQMMALVQRFKLDGGGHAASRVAVGNPAPRQNAKVVPMARPAHAAYAPVAASTGTDGGYEDF